MCCANVFTCDLPRIPPTTYHSLWSIYEAHRNVVYYVNSKSNLISPFPPPLFLCPQVLGVHLNKWTLDRRLGLTCLLMYAVFVCFSVLIEFNVFIFVNLPMCREILWSLYSSSSSSSCFRYRRMSLPQVFAPCLLAPPSSGFLSWNNSCLIYLWCNTSKRWTEILCSSGFGWRREDVRESPIGTWWGPRSTEQEVVVTASC